MIDEKNLTADDMLDLIMDHELNIVQVNGEIRVANYQEGCEIAAQTKGGISEAIRAWARRYNEVMGNG